MSVSCVGRAEPHRRDGGGPFGGDKMAFVSWNVALTSCICFAGVVCLCNWV